LPPERLGGERVVRESLTSSLAAIRIVLGRTLVTGMPAVSVSALMPIVAARLLHAADAQTTVLCGGVWMGAVIGALNYIRLRDRLEGRSFSIRA